MSNVTLKARIVRALAEFEAGRMDHAGLRSAVVENGRALEAIPYALVKGIDDLEYLLTTSQWYDEEGCETSREEALSAVKRWLAQVPEEL